MPLPIIPIAAVGVAALASVVAKRRLEGKTLLVLGAEDSGADAITEYVDHARAGVEAPWHQRLRDRASHLPDNKLDVCLTDSSTSGDLERVRDQVAAAALVCLVVSTHDIEDSAAMESTTRTAKLIGAVARKATKCVLVVNHANALPDADPSSLRSTPNVMMISDLVGASAVYAGNLDDDADVEAAVETILTVLATK